MGVRVNFILPFAFSSHGKRLGHRRVSRRMGVTGVPEEERIWSEGAFGFVRGDFFW